MAQTLRFLDEEQQIVNQDQPVSPSGQKLVFADDSPIQQTQRGYKQPEERPSVGRIIEEAMGEAAAAASRAGIRATMQPTESGGQMSRLAFFGPLASFKVAFFGDKPEVERAVLKGFQDPQSVERFQDEAIRKATEPHIEEWSQRKGIFSPENKFGKFLIGAESFARGIVPSSVGLLQDMAVNPVDVAMAVTDIALSIPKTAPKKTASEMLKKQTDDVVNHVVKPTSVGVKSSKTLKVKKDKMSSAISDVIDNVDNVVLKSGNEVPKTVDDLLDATAQTKAQIYKKYNDLKIQAGDAGVVLDKDKIARELLESRARTSLNVTSPQTKQYAQDLTLRLNDVDALTPDLVQNMIEDLNESLRSFYKTGGGGFGDIGKANVDAQFAQILRKNLDDAILKETKGQYQLFKNKYGALVEAEEQLAKRVLSLAKRNKVGLFEIVDVISAGQVLQGAMSGNFALASRGVLQAAGKATLKFINEPNTMVADLFSKAGRIKNIKPRVTSLIPAPVRTIQNTARRIPRQVERLQGEE
jgi:hypothetical protein